MGSNLDSESPINERVKQILWQKERSVTKFAEKIGIAQTTLNQQFNVGKLSLATLENILKAYPDVSAEWLLRGEGSMFQAELSENEQYLKKEYENLKMQVAVLSNEKARLLAQVDLLNKVIDRLLKQ